MKIVKNQTIAIATAILLTVSMALAIIPYNFASAHTPAWQIPTFAYIHVAPNPIGIGQTATVYMFLDKVFDPTSALTNDWRFRNYMLTITKPDNTSSTQTFAYISDPTSSQYIRYTPDQLGTYTFNFTFPGQDYNAYSHNPASDLVNDTYLHSSAQTTLTVQQDQIPSPITSYPLPTEYWTRPIYGENTDWWTISSNWLGTGSPVNSATGSGTISGFAISASAGSLIQRYPGDAIGPQTPHIMWTQPLQSGGVVGGNDFPTQGNTYFEGSAYNQRYTNPIIMDGKLYYTVPLSFTGTEGAFGPSVYGPVNCVDLRTGALIWSKNIPAPSFGYIYDVEDPNQHGVYPPILFTANFAQAFDGDTGTPLFNVTNVPFGSAAMGPQGEQLRYVISNNGTALNPNWQLAEWNSSKLWDYSGLSPAISTTTNGGTGNRYDWNASMSWFTGATPPTVLAAFYNNMMICINGSYPILSTTSLFGITSISSPYTYFAINLNASKGVLGSMLWSNTVTPPTGNYTITFGGADPTAGVFVESYKETAQWTGYSMTTGAKLWGPGISQTAINAFDYYGNPIVPFITGQVAYGKLYSSGYGGILYCYDLTSGNLLWTYGNGGAGNSTNAGLSVPYGDYPTFINAVGNGIIYLVTTEHTVETPIYKGALARAINATDGTEIWTLSDYTGEFAAMSYAIADGFATFFNGYDNQIYSVGRGPSSTMVQAPLTAATVGVNVVIQGTVMDISAGTKQNQQAADFPNGVPCASDVSMGDWMGYVYQQKPLPTNFTGVPVSIDAVDPNGNLVHIGTATTNANGLYHYTWTPPNVPGDYAVTATFAGTNGYWPSSATTAMNVVGEHPTPTPAPSAPASNTDTYVAGSAIAIIIVVIIVGALIILMQRRRPKI